MVRIALDTNVMAYAEGVDDAKAAILSWADAFDVASRFLTHCYAQKRLHNVTFLQWNFLAH